MYIVVKWTGQEAPSEITNNFDFKMMLGIPSQEVAAPRSQQMQAMAERER